MELLYDPGKGLWAEEPSSVERLHRSHFGRMEKGKVFLRPEEGLYAMSMMNGTCRSGDRLLSFNELAARFASEERLFLRYNAYRDWRDRGIILKRTEDVTNIVKRSRNLKRYPSKSLKMEKIKSPAFWYPKSMFSVMEDNAAGKYLFDEGWFGQFGVYKQDRGDLLKLNFLETVFLSKHFSLHVFSIETGKKISHSSILKHVIKEREYTKQLYEVYEDWRMKGFVVKTGFKFGSHFRIYFPGASPAKGGKWVHSRHVLHIFPKDQKLLISEWARAVRVAHGVKKTFLLCIPEMKKEDYVDYPAEYFGYTRIKKKGGWVRDTPDNPPKHLVSVVSEDEHIGGVELASLLRKAESTGTELVLSITDRETSITYYILKKVELPGSDYEYYEIEWMRP